MRMRSTLDGDTCPRLFDDIDFGNFYVRETLDEMTRQFRSEGLHRPQVALLDIGLPRMNGYELAALVRGSFGNTIKLVAMSGYGQPDDVRRAEAAGFDRHLTKPVDPRRLASALRDLNVPEGVEAAPPKEALVEPAPYTGRPA